jgi:cytochrome c-type biogenesis protein CcmH/NrfG
MGDICMDKYSTDTASAKKQTDLDQGESYYEQGTDKDKKDAKAILGLARVQYMRNDFEGALTFAKKSIKYDPNVKNAYVLLANIMNGIQPDSKEKQAEYTRIRIDALEHALALDETDTYLKFYLGINYGNNGDCDKAVEYLKKTMNYPGIPKQELETAKKILLQCGG